MVTSFYARWPWACICNELIKGKCEYYTHNNGTPHCTMKENPNYNCEYRHIDINATLCNTIPKRKKDVPI